MKRSLLFLVFAVLMTWTTKYSHAQGNETLSAGSYIIDMGVTPQTTANGLRPYGLVYALTSELTVPVKWVINPSKGSGGVDFSHNGYDYRGGPFMVEADFVNASVDSMMSAWEALGVEIDILTSDETVPVATTINYFMGWTLDQQNGSIAEDYLIDASIPSSAYNWLMPSELGCCNDVFVMPHADPEWSTHANLLQWNKSAADGGCEGTIWAACHAVSALENLFDPNNPDDQMNFLSEKTGVANTSDDYADNSLILWDDHDNGSEPFSYTNPGDAVMQFMGSMDDALTNGSEQIFIPHLQWRNSTTISGWDPDNDEVSGNQVAAVLAYGDAFGDSTKGKIMYQAGHNHGGSGEDNIAAQRAFMNFSFWAAADKSIKINSSLSIDSAVVQGIPANVSVIAGGGSGSYTYEWISSCPGEFGDPTAPSTTFTPYNDGECVITCIVTDDCGRISFSKDIADAAYNPCFILGTDNKISGTVYRDIDRDNVFDEGEHTFDDVVMHIYRDYNGDGILNGMDGDSVIATDTVGQGYFAVELSAPTLPPVTANRRINASAKDGLEYEDGSMWLTENKLEFKEKWNYHALNFTNVQVPRHAVVENAVINMRSSDDRDKTVNLTISIEASANPAALSTSDNDFSNRWDNSNTVSWTITERWDKNSHYNSVDISPLIQSIVDMDDWNAGQNMVIIIRYDSGDERKVYSNDGFSSKAPQLRVTYSEYDFPVSYIAQVDENTFPYGGALSSGNNLPITFTGVGSINCAQDFGLTINRSVTVDDVNVSLRNMAVSGSVLRNDLDPEGDLSIFSGYLNQDGSGQVLTSGVQLSGIDNGDEVVANAGILTFDVNGEYVFTPTNGFEGTVELDYIRCDNGIPAVCDTGSLKMLISNFPNPNLQTSNDVIAVNDYMVAYGSTILANVLDNDNDPEMDGISVTQYRLDKDGDFVPDETHTTFGTPHIVGGLDQYGSTTTKAASLIFNADGSYSLTPIGTFAGRIKINYTISDNYDDQYKKCKPAHLWVELVQNEAIVTNDPPFAGDDYANTIMNTPVLAQWLSNDNDTDDDDIRILGLPQSIDPESPGSGSILGAYSTQKGGDIIFYDDGNYEYTPPTDYFGPDQFAYQICDVDAQSACDSATIYLLTNPVYKDHGDLPAQFPTATNLIPWDLNQDGTPDLTGSIYLGYHVDGELATFDSELADGDNNDGLNDEDGLIFPNYERWDDNYTTEKFKVIVNGYEPGMTIFFGLWIDWDFDGTFDEFHSGSGASQDWAQRNMDTIQVPFNVPSNLYASDVVGVRLRAFQTMPDATMFGGSLRSGEVEDYVWYLSGLLPVELSEFSVHAEDRDAVLEWSTASEVNNDYFSIQRSEDLINWQEIGTIEGQGNSTELIEYDFVDPQLADGRYYYRLQQFDYDGTNDYSDIRFLEISGDEVVSSLETSEISLFPMPVRKHATIHVSGLPADPATVAFTSLTGSVINEFNLENNQVDLSQRDIPSGTYVMTINQGHETVSKKVIVLE